MTASSHVIFNYLFATYHSTLQSGLLTTSLNKSQIQAPVPSGATSRQTLLYVSRGTLTGSEKFLLTDITSVTYVILLCHCFSLICYKAYHSHPNEIMVLRIASLFALEALFMRNLLYTTAIRRRSVMRYGWPVCVFIRGGTRSTHGRE
jgi:hypothetical protein